MANTPRKVKDPAEAALSAIEEALNLVGAGEREAPPVDQPSPRQTIASPAPERRSALEPSGPAPANDDARSFAHIMYALQRRPS